MMFRRLRSSILAFSLAALAISSLAHAERHIRVGPEWTFTNPEMIKQTTSKTQFTTRAGKKLLQRWQQKMEEFCKQENCLVEKIKIKEEKAFKVTFGDGWWFAVSQDPAVLEVTTLKGYPEDFEVRRGIIEKHIFGLAEELGLKPHERVGGGDLNFDRQDAFGNNVLLFRNFIVDRARHPELANGIFGNHIGNGPPLMALSQDSRMAFEEIIRDFDKHQFGIDSLVKKIVKTVYTNNPYGYGKPGILSMFGIGRSQAYDHYQELNYDFFTLETPEDKRRLQVRGVHPQANLDQFILAAKLITARINYLEQIAAPIQLSWPATATFADGALITLFKKYVEEMGLKFDDYKSLILPETLANGGEGRPIRFAEENALGWSRTALEASERIHSQYDTMELNEVRKQAQSIGSDYRALNTRPRILSVADYEKVQKGTVQISKAWGALVKDVMSADPRIVKAGIIPENVLAGILKAGFNESIRPLLESPYFGFTLAPDLIRGADGEFYLLEVNVAGSPGGQGDATQNRYDLLNLMPEYQNLLKADSRKSFARVMVEKLRSLSVADQNIAFAASDEDLRGSYSYQVEDFRAQGVAIFAYDAANIDARSGKVIMENDNGTKTQLSAIIVRGSKPSWLVKHFKNTTRAVLNGGARLVSMGPEFASDKELLMYANDIIKFYLNEEPIFKSPRTENFRARNGEEKFNKEVFERVKYNIDQYVIKTFDGMQGSGVWIGSKVQDVPRLMKMIAAEPTNYVVQKFVPISTHGSSIVDIRSYGMVMMDGQVAVGEHLWSRSLRAWADGKLNTHGSAGVVPIFIEDEILHQDVWKKISAATKASQVLSLVHENSVQIGLLADLAIARFIALQPTINEMIFYGHYVRYWNSLSFLATRMEQSIGQRNSALVRLYKENLRYQKEHLNDEQTLSRAGRAIRYSASAQEYLETAAFIRQLVNVSAFKSVMQNTYHTHFLKLNPTTEQFAQYNALPQTLKTRVAITYRSLKDAVRRSAHEACQVLLLKN